MISSLLGGTTNIKDLFSQKIEPFSLFTSDASGNDATGATGATIKDASGNGGMFGNTFSLFTSDASGNDATGATGATATVDASGNGGMFGNTLLVLHLPTPTPQIRIPIMQMPVETRIRLLRRMPIFSKVYFFYLCKFVL